MHLSTTYSLATHIHTHTHTHTHILINVSSLFFSSLFFSSLFSSTYESKHRDVLVVPCIPVSNRSTVGDTSKLVPVVPPRHDTGVLGGVVAEPPVGLAVVVDNLFTRKEGGINVY
jgi:hypothetical protein